MSGSDAAPARTANGWRTPVVLLLVAFALFGLTARHGGGSWDYYTANYASWHLAHTGSPYLGDETIPGLEDDPEVGTWIKSGDHGNVISRFPGVVAIALPAYWVAEAVNQADEMTVVPGAITAAGASALALLLMFLALRTRLSERRAAVSALMLGFATPMWSISADAVWPHTVTVLGIAGMAWASATRRWWAVGLFGGIALWGRLHAAVIVAVLGVVLGWRERKPSITVVIGAVSATFLVLLCAWTRWMYGTWSPTGSYNDSVFDVAPQGVERLTNQLGMWIAPDRGILVWTPVLVLLAPALFRAWSGLPDWSRALFVGGLAYTVIQTFLITFTGGDNFYGYRLGLEFLACATPAYAFSAPLAGELARKLLTPVLALQVAAFSLGAVFNRAFLPEEDAWHDNGFLFVMRELWPVGPVLVVLVVAGAVLVQRRRTHHELAAQPTEDQRAVPAGSSGTDSSHSVP